MTRAAKRAYRFACTFAVVAALFTCTAAAHAQDGIVTVRVLTQEDDTPLANAEVIDLATGARALTREGGMARARIPAKTSLRLRVRQLGFAYVDLDLERDQLRADGSDTVVVRLRRVPFALPGIATSTARECPTLTEDARPLTLWALEQLRESAERYESFRKAYPFDLKLERRSVVQSSDPGAPRIRRNLERGFSGSWGERYDPGDIVREVPLGFSVPILFVATLGDPAFWDYHCPVAADVAGDEGARRIRLRFAPSGRVRWSDWEGTATMDSATSRLVRVDFSLAVRQAGGPRRLEGYTVFSSPSPFVVVPDSTIAWWWRSAPSGNEAWPTTPDVVQMLRVAEMRYRKEKPPAMEPSR